MEKEKFLNLLIDNEALNRCSFEQLEQLTVQFPYALHLRLLLLKKYKSNGHSALGRYEALCALYAPDLQNLQKYLEQ